MDPLSPVSFGESSGGVSGASSKVATPKSVEERPKARSARRNAGGRTPLSSVNTTPSSKRGGSPAVVFGSQPGTPATPGGGLRSRPDLGTPSHGLRQVQLTSELGTDNLAETSEGDNAFRLVVWGSDVSAERCRRQFTRFLRSYQPTLLGHDEALQTREPSELLDSWEPTRPYYLRKLREVSDAKDKPILEINCSFLKSFDAQLYRQLVMFPSEVIGFLDDAANEVFAIEFPDVQLTRPIETRPFLPSDSESARALRALGPSDVDQLVVVRGMVIRLSPVIPEMRSAFFRCSICSNSVTIDVDHGNVSEPRLCTNCNSKHSFTIIHNLCTYFDKQLIRLQESPDDTPPGRTPHALALYVNGDLVDAVQPGDRVAVTGIYRTQPVRVNARMQTLRAVYRTHIDVLHFRRDIAGRVPSSKLADPTSGNGVCPAGADANDYVLEWANRLSPERVAEMKKLSEAPDVYERLAHALAPSVYEHEDIKKGLLLQLMAGVRKDLAAVGRGFSRADIHVMLCGDPGTSKSQLLQYVHRLAPRSQYTAGRGSSAVGLTAFVAREPDTHQTVLQPGALVLSDRGVCCIDEFDKMSEAARTILHEVMEQQTLSIAKAGIVCQLNARAAVLAACNPVSSRWDRSKSILDNIRLPPTLLSRFDLVFLMIDPQDEVFDRRLARHLISLFGPAPNTLNRGDQNPGEDNGTMTMNEFARSSASVPIGANQAVVDIDLLRDYIAYAKAKFDPMIGEPAQQALVEAYVRMRQGPGTGGQVAAYPRQLEALIRIAEAHARLRWSSTVDPVDVQEARRLYGEALKQAATDPTTGRIDVALLATGFSAAGRKRRAMLREALKRLLSGMGTSSRESIFQYEPVLNQLRSQSDVAISWEMFEDALRDLADEDTIALPGNRTIRLLVRA